MDNDVICVDNPFIGSKANIAQLSGEPDFECICHGMAFPLFPLYVEVDEIYPLACPDRRLITDMIPNRNVRASNWPGTGRAATQSPTGRGDGASH